MDRFFQNNLVLRISALILACILWIAVNMPSTPGQNGGISTANHQFAFPVQVQTASNMVAVSVDVQTAVVTVNGNLVNLATLPEQMVGATVVANTQNLAAGTHNVKLNVVNLTLPANSFTIQPTTARIVLANRESAVRPVRVSISGTPLAGYTVGTVQTNFQFATIQGAQAVLNRVTAVMAMVAVDKAASDVTNTVNLIPVDAQGKSVAGASVNPSDVIVHIPIEAMKQIVRLTPQAVGSPAPGFAVAGITISPDLVTGLGSEPSSTRSLQVNVPVDVSGMRQTGSVQVQLPSTSTTMKFQPDTVTATVQMDTSQSRTLTGLPVVVENTKGTGNVALPGSAQISVTISGPKSMVANLNPADVIVYVDGSRLTAKSRVAPLSVHVPAYITVTQMSQNTIPVKVTKVSGQ